jgi:hypothetical protein
MAVALSPPDAALPYLPLVRAESAALWADHPHPAYLAAQIEQETCPSLKSKLCWNPRAELKTSREYGFGLGQLTVTSRFNNFEESKKWDKSLRDWQWSDRFDAKYQIRALVAYDRNLYRQIRGAADADNQYAFALSAYNGGLGGLLKDRELCRNTKGCDESRWWGHVEHTSLKAKTAVSGYGQSFFKVNRDYVVNVMRVRAPRYESAFPAKK